MAKIKIVGILSRYAGDRKEVEVEGGISVEEILAKLEIPSPLVGVVLVNGKQVDKSHVIREGDEVKLIPLIGGGEAY
ncbi:MAG: MoaD/ThiS family protein [Anaerolineae bacterium]|nr:MoaD/ThiS family protein [Anaerolineae bacterium]MDW8102879.1 MoaD/ThiS family protein [Anaerolineae bacterium]